MKRKDLKRLEENIEWLENNPAYTTNVSIRTFFNMIFYGVKIDKGFADGVSSTIREELKQN